MKIHNASIFEYTILYSQGDNQVYPYLRQNDGKHNMQCLSSIHGRSFVVGRHDNGRFVVSKGNGLSYTQNSFLFTPEMPTDVWGLLLKTDATRDFLCGLDVQSLGVKTNQMEYVIEIDYPIHIAQTGVDLKPCLLQYSVECPWRIADAAFIGREQILSEVAKWQQLNEKGFKENYLIAANVFLKNLRIMHDSGVLHNALTYENYTWALELLDFELCHTPQHPYEKEDYVRHVPTLYAREIIDVYKLINYIACVLREDVDFDKTNELFADYGFDIEKFRV